MKKTLVICLCFLILCSTVVASVSCDKFDLDDLTDTVTGTSTEAPKTTDSVVQTNPPASEAPTVTDMSAVSEPVTESETSVVTNAPTESETVTESETPIVTDAPTESETVTESETPTVTEAPTETESHVHDFDIKDTSENYLKSEATCLKPAYYYYSCSCGEKGRDYFKSGQAKGHVYDQRNTADEFAKVKQTCTERGAYYYSCVCGAKGDRLFYGDRPEGHVFDQKNTSPEFAKTLPSCTKYGSYYYSCVCGAMGEKTFNGREFGHIFDIMNTDEKYLKTPQTSSSAAVYYYSCSCGAVGTETFSGTLNTEQCEHSFVLGRGEEYDESTGVTSSYDAFFCRYCSLEVIEHGNADNSISGGNNKVKFYITGDRVNMRNYKIVVYGTGDMPDFAKDNLPLWEWYYPYITEIVIRDGITSIGSYAFYRRDLDHSVTFTIADTVKTVKAYGLHLKTSNLVLGKGVERLEAYSLGSITNSVYLPRSLKYLDGLLGVTTFYEGSRAEFLKIQMQYQNKVVTIGQYASRVDSTILDQYYVYLNADRVGDRSELLIWN